MGKFTIFAILCVFLAKDVVAQFSTKTNLNSLSITTNTREKPQSKVWMHDGKHWTLLSNSSGAHVWRLDGTTWTRVLTVSSSTNLRADCKVAGNIVHVFLFRGNSSDLVSIEYVPATSTYKLWTGRTSTVRVTTDSNAETATIDIDSNGRMWMAYDDNSSIKVRWSDSPYSSWSTPITVASGINADDIGAVIALPMFNKIGVLWSNQQTERFGFKLHTDGATPATWSSDELPASQSALNVGAGESDDHLNMKVASDGTLYCAVKTGYDTPGYPRISLIVRRPNGTWDNLYNVSELGTRGIVVLNELAGKIRVIYTETEDGGDIFYRESSISPIAFGQQFTLISGEYNNATSTKTNFTSQTVILASTSSTAVGVLVSDAGTPLLPGIPTLASPANNATGIAIAPTLSWNAAANATSYQVQVATASDFMSPVSDVSNITGLSTQVSGLAYNTQHFWRVRAVNASGMSNWSTVRSFTTVTAPVGVPDTPTLNSPANNATGIAITPTLSWNTAANATSYQVQVATISDFSSTVSNVSNITGLSTQISNLAYNTQHFWRVRAINASGMSDWSDTWSFSTITQAQYSLNVTVNGSGGSVSKSPNQASYLSGTSVQLTAMPSAGFQFSGWSGDASGTTNPLTVTMNSNKNITATFTAIPTTGVTGFNLINASSDQSIQSLVSGAVLNLATLPTRRLNIRALTNPTIVGSVGFNLSGQQTKVRSDESGPHYSLYGDSNGDYSSWTPTVGSYTLTARTYTGANGSGTPSALTTITFTVIDQANTRMATTSSAPKTVGDQQLKVSPNPFKDALTLELLPGIEAEKATVTLTTLKGKTVYQKEVKVNANLKTIELDRLSKLPSGMYLLKLQLDEKSIVRKVVKQ